MTNLAMAEMDPDGSMPNFGPRAGGPTPRRSFTPGQKLEFLTHTRTPAPVTEAVPSFANRDYIPPSSPSGASFGMPVSSKV